MASVRTIVLAAMLCCFTRPAFAEVPKTQEERTKILKSLHWTEGAKLDMTEAEAKLDVPKDYKVLDKEDAQTFIQVINGGPRQSNIDAVISDPRTHNIVLFENVREGYVKSDDWNKVDADAMLKQMIENTEKANEEKEQEGIPSAHITGWAHRPEFDAANNSAQWAIGGTVENKKIVNAVELVLGRKGYERLTWVGPGDDSPVPLLSQARKSFSFKSGSTYADHKDGDKIAAYGLAALITAAVGAKVAGHFGLFAGLAILIKKGLAFIIAGTLVVWQWMKAFFNRNKKQQPMTSNSDQPPPPPTVH